MTARAIWKARIRFAQVDVGVKLYSAIQDRKVHFRLLHQKDAVPVAQHMIDARSGEPVPNEKIRRGVEIETGEIVILDEDELKPFEPEESRDITIFRFLHSGLIRRQWFNRPYYLGPDQDADAYTALAVALEKEKKEGFAGWTMRKSRYIGVLRSHDGYLNLTTLRTAGEVVDAAGLPKPEGRPMAKPELKMAEQLIKALEGDFDPRAFRDEYQDGVRDLIAAKARGETITLKKAPERKTEVISFTDLLKESVRQAKKERKIA